MGKGGRGATNVPKLKGSPTAGSRPAGSLALVPSGQYPTVLGTHRLPDVPGAVMNEPGPAINKPGKSTVNSTPA
jgi:hypothetical protein